MNTCIKINLSFFKTGSVTSLLVMLLAITALLAAQVTMLQLVNGHHVLDEIDVPNRPMRLSISDYATASPSNTTQPGSLLSVTILGEPLVSIINTLTDNITKNIDTTTAVGGVFEVETITNKNKVYTAPFEGGQLGVYNLQSGALLKAIELHGAQRAEISFYVPPNSKSIHIIGTSIATPNS